MKSNKTEDLYLVFICGTRTYAITMEAVDSITYLEDMEESKEQTGSLVGEFQYKEEMLPLIDARFILENRRISPMEKNALLLLILRKDVWGFWLTPLLKFYGT